MGFANIGSLEDLRCFSRKCRQCGLAETRQSVVFGEGSDRAEIFLLGKAPGAHEDESGRPFVGRAGELLRAILAQAGFARDSVFITGSVKCRPPRNRNPRRSELAACRPLLEQQLALIRPRVVVCLGLVAAQNLLDHRVKLKEVRGKFFCRGEGFVLPTYHPAAVLRHTVSTAVLLQDFRAVKQMLQRLMAGPFPGNTAEAETGCSKLKAEGS